MTNDVLASVFDFDAVSAETIDLSSAQIERAVELSHCISEKGQQWQAYLNALAALAVEQWLEERAPEIAVELPSFGSELVATARMRVGEFTLNSIAMGSVRDCAIPLPQRLVSDPDLAAHFYVVVEILEELELANIQCFIRRDRLIEQFPEATELLPIDRFEQNPDDLLLYLRCLEPSAIPLPETSPSTPWMETVVNVATWLQDRLDDAAEELAWVLLPAFSPDRLRLNPASALRSPVEELDDIIAQLQRSGSDIAPQARGAYQTFFLGDIRLRLYVVTWAVLSPDNVPEWKLMLVLGTPSGNSLPNGTCLRVSDDTSLLVEQEMTPKTVAPYLYTRVVGTWEETFTITISLDSGASLTLPPFAFHP